MALEVCWALSGEAQLIGLRRQPSATAKATNRTKFGDEIRLYQGAEPGWPQSAPAMVTDAASALLVSAP